MYLLRAFRAYQSKARPSDAVRERKAGPFGLMSASTSCGHTAPLTFAALCRYCCKSRKLPGDNFPAESRYVRRPPIFVASVPLPRSPVSLWSGDEVPHIFTRKSRLRPGEFLVSSAKRLLQQYLPQADLSRCSTLRCRRLLDQLVG